MRRAHLVLAVLLLCAVHSIRAVPRPATSADADAHHWHLLPPPHHSYIHLSTLIHAATTAPTTAAGSPNSETAETSDSRTTGGSGPTTEPHDTTLNTGDNETTAPPSARTGASDSKNQTGVDDHDTPKNNTGKATTQAKPSSPTAEKKPSSPVKKKKKKKQSFPPLVVLGIAVAAIVGAAIPIVFCFCCGCVSCLNREPEEALEDSDEVSSVKAGSSRRESSLSGRSKLDCRNSDLIWSEPLSESFADGSEEDTSSAGSTS